MLAREVDRATRRWVRATGRPVALDTTLWLQGPVGDLDAIGDRWLHREARRLDAVVAADDGDAGLLPSVDLLSREGFAPADLAAEVRDFYERTSAWRLDVWAGWSPWAWTGGWLISQVFAGRLEQLALPMRPLDVAHGMTSDVVPLLAGGRQVAAMWLRRLRSTGAVVFSGLYSVVQLPSGEPAVRVVFPLPEGRLVVLLRPVDAPSGGLLLESGPGGWGEPGTYLVVETPSGCWARRVPLHESFNVHLDDEGLLRTDHHLRLGAATVLRLHYRLSRA